MPMLSSQYLAAMGLSCVVCGWRLWSETRHTLRAAAHSVLGAAQLRWRPAAALLRTGVPHHRPASRSHRQPDQLGTGRLLLRALSALWGCGGGRAGSVSQRKAEAAVEAASSSRAFHIDPAPLTG